MPVTRREVLESIECLWDRYPDMRLGQLITNVGIFASDGAKDTKDIWDLENDEIVAAVFRHLGPGE